MAASRQAPPSTAELQASFDASAALTVGLEEELFVVDAQTLDLVPRADEIVEADPRAKPELVAAEVELATPPCDSVAEAIGHLAEGRRALAAAAADRGLALLGAGAHPFAAAEGELTTGERYDRIAETYGPVVRRQLVAALQVHVAVRPADRALAVHNALRSHLPDLAALAANAPFHEGRDTGLASIRPLIATLLSRQGVPPELHSWDEYAGALERSGEWWWELRPHHRFGTLELRVPDTQATLADARAVAAVAHGLVTWLSERHAAGEDLPVEQTWVIAERRWAALRHGPTGALADRLGRLFDDIAPFADADGLARARELLAGGGPAAALREAASGDLRTGTAWLAERFLEGVAG
jgi:carboxylate-amine ligase